jgi:ubiquinone/menaquinone biosynthesis C-methylase UbiE
MNNTYIPPLKYSVLTPLYDFVVAHTTRENYFKQQIVDTLISHAQSKPLAQVLDIGCGTGTLALMIKTQLPATQVIGLDADQSALATAKRKSLIAKQTIQFDQGMSYELPYSDHSFDSVVSSLFFHHLSVPNKVKTMAEIKRVLKPRGRFLLADFGKPTSLLQRVLFYPVQLLDGSKSTGKHVAGILPELLNESGFTHITVQQEIPTAFGTITLLNSLAP